MLGDSRILVLEMPVLGNLPDIYDCNAIVMIFLNNAYDKVTMHQCVYCEMGATQSNNYQCNNTATRL